MFAEQKRQVITRNIPSFTLVSSSVPKRINKYWIQRNIALYIITEEQDRDYLLEYVETQIMSARLPSDGFNPDVVDFEVSKPFWWYPEFVLIFAIIVSEVF